MPPQRHQRYGGALRVAIAVSALMMIVEVYGAWITGSLALLSDAGHMLADLTGLILAYVALKLASRPATKTASYGFQRYEVLAAGANGLLLVGLVVALVWRAIHRFQNPLKELDTPLVLAVATLGLLVNVFAAWLLMRDQGENINARGALLNLLGDAVASMGVIVATLIVHFTGNTVWDTYISIFVAGVILFAALPLLRQTGAILLETTPPEIDLAEVKSAIETLEHVVNVHDLHCWTLTPGHHAITMHVSIRQEAVPTFHHVTRNIEELLEERWGLGHATIQVEPEGDDPESDSFDPVAGTSA